jgi:hypothetical protein
MSNFFYFKILVLYLFSKAISKIKKKHYVVKLQSRSPLHSGENLFKTRSKNFPPNKIDTEINTRSGENDLNMIRTDLFVCSVYNLMKRVSVM